MGRYAQETFRSLNREDSLKEEVATHSSNLAWEIPWTEEPTRLSAGVEQFLIVKDLLPNVDHGR